MSGLDFPGMEELVNPRPGKALANWEKLVKKVLAADDAESGLAQTLGQGADLPSSLGNKRIDAVLAAADHVRQWSPQVARILCEHAYTLSQQLDPNSRGRGMLQFKTGLLSIISQKKSKKEGEAIDRRNDAALVLDFYKFYRNKVDQLEAAEEERHQISSRSHVAPTTEGKRREANIRQAYQTFRILNDVVDSLVPPEEKRRLIGSQQEIGRPRRNIEADAAKASEYKPYNILPLETPNADDLFVSLPQVKGAHSALRLPEGFPRLPNTVPRPTQRPADIFDLLQYIFGFQKDSVNNQREHVILMLANTHARVSQPDDGANGRAIEHLHDRVLDNYNKWCTYLRKESHCKKDTHVGRYSAALENAPLWPVVEQMASEVLQQLEKAVANRARGVGDGDHEFLDQVVKPVYDVISAEAKHGKGKSHSEWRNYDDLNEYFWSDHCFSLGWPWSLDAPFFVKPESGAEGNVSRWKQKRMGKTLFVEHRTGFHIFRSFHRLWIFFLLALQGLATIAFTDKLRSVHRVKVILSLGPSFVLLRFIQSIFDVILMFGAYSSTRPQNVARVFVRFIWFLVSAVFITFLYIRLMMEANKNSTSALFNSYVLVLGVYAASQLIVSSISRISALRLQVDKIGSWGIIRFISWLQQERYYVGRGLYEKTLDFVIYSAFWVTVLVAKFTFSYFFQIKPLVAPTRAIVGTNIPEYNWHSFFSRNHHNTWTVAGIWAPVVLIYFLDTQVWYTVFSSFWGGFDGALMRLGEIRSLSMLRHRFFTFPDEFARRLVPSALSTKINTSGTPGAQFSQRERTNAQKFAHIWNEIIKNLREEDYISNKEKEFLLMPKNRGRLQLVQWPLFLLANKVPIAINMCMEHKGSQDELQEKIFKDKYMASAVQEAYASVQQMLLILVQDGPERNWVQRAFGYIDAAISDSALVHSLRLKKLGGSDGLVSKLGVLTKNLIGLEKSPDDEKDKKLSEIKKTLRKFFEIVMHDIFSDQIRDKFEPSDILEKARKTPDLLFSNIYWPSSTENHDEMVRLLHLLTSELSASNVPKNAEAQRRLEFFTNSLFMDMPETPPLQKMFSFSVLTPYYAEDVMFSYSALNEPNEDGITTLFYLQKIFPDEWKNYLERVFPPEDEDNETEEDALKRGEKELLVHIRQLKREERKKDAGAESNEDGPILQLRLWASYRGQTLARTVRGMMYYRSALVLLNQLEDPPVQDEEAARRPGLGTMAPSLRAESIADTKFSYVVSCQIYGSMKKASDRAKKQKADDIGYLLKSHEGLRVAYIHTEETTVDGKNIKAYFSKLVKADSAGEQEIYSIKLPGDPLIGEGKPENQNHAIVFTRGDAIQTIDMNQDNYFEEAVKMRNLLQEFDLQHGLRKPSILGVREHVFTGSVSSLGWFMSNQETSFVTLGQRVLAKPLKVRMHYGHPDVFDRIFHISRGGISKASKVINISEDIYAGFNSTLRQGNVTHHEYIQVGKGRDVGLNQIAIFEGKVAGGNGEQVLSRDIYRLGQLFDFFRMLSFYYTSVGFYICTMMTVLTVYVFLYGKVYLALSGVESALSEEQTNNKALQTALNTQFLFQIGIFTAVPMIMGSILERGLIRALMDFVTMQLQGASVFFTFSLGTRTHYFGRTILHGGAKYQSTGRGFVVQHISFAENYRLFSRSHFVKGFEVALLLIVYGAFGSQKGTVSYILLTFSSWFLALSWLYAPFLFNPAGFEWQKTVEDFEKWNTWMFYRGGVGVKGNESWEAWWEDELSHITSPRGRLWEIILSLRFLIFQYGVVYSLQVTGNHTSLNVYWISWLALLCLLTILKAFTFKSAKYQLLVRLCQGILLLLLTIGLVLSIVLTTLTVGDVFAISLALLPTGWAILSVSVAIKPVMKKLRLWKTVRSLARFYDAVFGLLIFIPIAALSWIPFVSTFQTRLVFNQAFSRGLEISLILSGKKDEEEKLDGGAKAKVLCASCKKCLGETKKDETKKEN